MAEQDCSKYFMAHDQMINQHSKDIDQVTKDITSINALVLSLPGEIRALTTRFDTFLNDQKEQRSLFMKKDVFQVERDSVCAKIDKLEGKMDKFNYGLIAFLIYAIIDIFKTIVK